MKRIYNIAQVAIMIACAFLAGFCVGSQNALSSFEAVAAEVQDNLSPKAEVVRSHGFIEAHSPEFISLGLYKVTAYCPCEKCCGIWAERGVDKNGNRVTPGSVNGIGEQRILPGDMFVAADSSFPYGTKLNIPGYGIVSVRDRGGAIKGRRLDVFFDTHQEALNWGVQNLEITEFEL